MTSPAFHVLALNAGSSSLKSGLYRVDASRVTALMTDESDDLAPEASLARLEARLADPALPRPEAIGHRVVHGGPRLCHHALIDDDVLAQLAAATVFAPLHTPAALALIHAAMRRFPALPQVACLDTHFHASMPAVARTLPLPREIRDAGIRRYGFHGLSCESVVHRLPDALRRRLLIAHLGNGASVTAVRDGASVDTSMGLTPTGGLVMGARSGDLDPGVLVWLMRTRGLDADALEDLVDRRAGLQGLSGLSADLRVLHAAADANPDAALALAIFCQAAAKQLAAMCSVLGGVDAIVFTGGIGEHDAAVRASICERLACVGVVLDADRNADAGRHTQGIIEAAASRCRVLVMPAQEDEQIARHVAALCHA
jgi:acetate kinase